MKPLLPYSIGEPPDRLKRARFDNIALVPASLLKNKEMYQLIANTLPPGSILLVQTASPRQQKILAKVVTFLRTHGRQVITLPLEKITRNTKKSPRGRAENLQPAF